MLTTEQQGYVLDCLPVVSAALSSLQRSNDIDCESEAQFLLVKLCAHRSLPDTPEDRKRWTFSIIRRHLLRYLARRKGVREIPLEACLPNIRNKNFKDGYNEDAAIAEIFGHDSDAPTVLIREREHELARAELAQHEAANKPMAFSKKQFYIQRARRKRLYGSTGRPS